MIGDMRMSGIILEKTIAANRIGHRVPRAWVMSHLLCTEVQDVTRVMQREESREPHEPTETTEVGDYHRRIRQEGKYRPQAPSRMEELRRVESGVKPPHSKGCRFPGHARR